MLIIPSFFYLTVYLEIKRKYEVLKDSKYVFSLSRERTSTKGKSKIINPKSNNSRWQLTAK